MQLPLLAAGLLDYLARRTLKGGDEQSHGASAVAAVCENRWRSKERPGSIPTPAAFAQNGIETVGVSPISIASRRTYRRGMSYEPQMEGGEAMYKRILKKRILKGTIIALALFAMIPVSNAAARGGPVKGSKATLRAKALGKQHRFRIQYGSGNPAIEIPVNRPAFGWRP